MKKFVLTLISIWSFMILSALFLFRFYDWYVLTGPSMEPTLRSFDVVLVRQKASRLQRGDIVLFQRNGWGILFNKRVIGLPGDRVEIKKGQLYVNGKLFQKGPLAHRKIPHFKSVIVPQGKVFVMGDNPEKSTDSRAFGPIPINSIIGKADAVIWPLSHFQFF
ncbi:signal peptidase I [Polycladomyces sp. WAk]|uniref:Signal peptidase I n=1 Tax=Polycladomyces zharkentensis TaxID=2807616 RepID=A0ABS2WI85_9BACL|nr:signal peptidase I [Polycladomyces sp. WAk]MBN2909188.1 signal peptidase I [Polycladomyces sp. WAk]